MIIELVMGERFVFLSRMRDTLEQLSAVEEVLLTSAPSAVIDVAARHDPELAALLLDLSDINARVLDRLSATLQQPRDALVVQDIIGSMRAGAEAVGDLLGAAT